MSSCPLVLSSYLQSDVARAIRGRTSFSSRNAMLHGFPARTVAALYQLEKATSKFEDHTVLADGAAIAKFLEANERQKEFEIRPNTSGDEVLLGEFGDAIYRAVEPLRDAISFEDLFLLGGVGPGSSILADRTDIYTKLFDSPLSHTSEVLRLFFEKSASMDDRWLSALTNRQAKFGVPRLVEGSKLSCVPKDRDVSRTICTEPVLNMFYQLALGKSIDKILKRRGIDLSTQQDLNRWLAWEGSLTGQFSTIDLSSASDSISLQLCQQFIPKFLLDRLMQLRSPVTFLGQRRIPLHMISSMGNGFTFSLMTLIFSCVVEAVYRTLSLKFSRVTNGQQLTWTVFGDDIIVERTAFHRVIRLLGLLGFSANLGKTFSEGPFRESCGQDYYLGSDIRPVFIRRLDTAQDHISVFNRLARWGAKWDISLRNTLRYLTRHVGRKLYVPRWESDDAGLKVPRAVACPSRDKDFQSDLYRCWIPRLSKVDVNDDPLSSEEQENPQGLQLAFLHGSLRAGFITLRENGVSYRRKRRIAPGWDAILDPTAHFMSREGWLRWETELGEVFA